MKKLLFTITSALALLSSNLASAEILRIGVDPSLPPFEYVNSENGEFTGFDIDLMQALGRRLNATIVWLPMGFDSLLAAVRSETIDAAISDISVTPERLRRVDFTRPIFNSGTTILVRKEYADTVKTFADLQKHIVCAPNGTSGQNILERYPNIQIVKTFSTAEAIEQVKMNRCIATVGDRPVFQYYLNTHPESQKILVHKIDSQTQTEHIAIAVNKKNTALLNRLNQAIYDMIYDGEFTVISEKWFK